MKKASKGLEYTQHETGVCSLSSAVKCKATNVIIPEKVLFKGKVVEIDQYAFRNHTRMKSIVIPEGVVSIGNMAFENCKNLEHVVLPQSLKSIGSAAFINCHQLKSIVLPATITSIASNTFAYCPSLESMDLRYIHSIGRYAFYKCDSLTDIVISDDVTKIEASAFQYSGYYKQHKNWKNGLLYLGKWLIGCNGSLNEYIIKKDTIGIAADAFVEDQHVKRTKNPEYNDVWESFYMALECPNIPLPDVMNTPEYFEEIVPAKIRYKGTSEQWSKIIKLDGEKQIPAFVTTQDGKLETYF